MGRETSTENERRGYMESTYMYMYHAIKRRGGVYCSQYSTPPRCREVVWYCKEPILCMTGKDDLDCFRLWHTHLCRCYFLALIQLPLLCIL